MRLATLLLSLAGLGASIYLTIEHYDSSVPLLCSSGGTVDCAKVTSSTYSTLAGIPVAVLGLLFFVALVAAFIPPLSRWERIDEARLACVGVGMAFVLYLVWAELFGVNAICLWCTAVHVITLALLATTTWSVTHRRE
jgi:uncharacterized membrane protein